MTSNRQLYDAFESLGKTQGRKLVQLLDSTKALARMGRRKERDAVAVRDAYGNIIGYMKADAYDELTTTPSGKRKSMSPKALENLKEAMKHG
jgi:hypothetical protein